MELKREQLGSKILPRNGTDAGTEKLCSPRYKAQRQEERIDSQESIVIKPFQVALRERVTSMDESVGNYVTRYAEEDPDGRPPRNIY